jgi:hypothetical protein
VSGIRIALHAAALAVAAAVLVPAAVACPKGYSYAGLYSESASAGIAATISMLEKPAVVGGFSHVAGWVGVGGPGLGPHGEDEWLQVGLATFGDSRDGRLYFEIAQPGQAPRYTELASGIKPGQRVRVALLELPFAPDTWIVVSPAGIAGPFYLPESHDAWAPIATGESYTGGAQCNRSSYRFERLRMASADGSWHVVRRASALRDPGWQLRRRGTSSFSAASA